MSPPPEATITVAFQPPGSFDPGGVVAQPLDAQGQPVGEPVAVGFKKVGSLVVWSGLGASDGSIRAVRFTSTAGWTHLHALAAPTSTPGGTVRLSQDFGGPDALAYRNRLGNPVGGAAVLLFPESDCVGEKPRPGVKPAAQAVTDRDGRWATRVAVRPGPYILVFEKPGLYGPDAVRVSVPA